MSETVTNELHHQRKNACENNIWMICIMDILAKYTDVFASVSHHISRNSSLDVCKRYSFILRHRYSYCHVLDHYESRFSHTSRACRLERLMFYCNPDSVAFRSVEGHESTRETLNSEIRLFISYALRTVPSFLPNMCSLIHPHLCICCLADWWGSW
jgi:hypothetical protein